MFAETLLPQLAAFFAARSVDAYVVGGQVRDRLLSRPPGGDFDLAVAGDAARLAAALAAEFGGSVAPLSPERGLMRVVGPPPPAPIPPANPLELGWTMPPGEFPPGIPGVLAAGDGAYPPGIPGVLAGEGAYPPGIPGAAAGDGTSELADGGIPGASAAGRWTVDLAELDGGGIEADLGRRDFGVNAMAAPLRCWLAADGDDDGAPDWWAADGGLIDPHNGRGDLRQKRLRALNDGVFAADPGRLLRAVRLAGQLGFRIEPATIRRITAEAHRLKLAAPDRVREEFLRILAADGAKGRLETLDRLGLLAGVIPELPATQGVAQPQAHHYWDVWGHTLHAVAAAEGVTGGHRNSPVYSCVPWTPGLAAYFDAVVTDGHTRRTALKLGALFHDIAKPQTRTIEADGRTRFFGHAEQGANIAARRLRQLRLSARGVKLVSQLVRHHLRPTGMMQEGGRWPTNRAIHRYFRDVGSAAVDTLYLCLADYLAAKGPELAHPQWLAHARMIGHIMDTGARPPVAPPPAPRLVTGRDLMRRLQLPPGPAIGRLLEAIAEARAAGEIATQEQAFILAAKLLHSPAAEPPPSPAALVPPADDAPSGPPAGCSD